MSRPLDKALHALLRALIAFLLALGLGMPLLHGAGQAFLLGRYVLLCAAISLFAAGLSALRRFLLPLALLALSLWQGVLLTQRTGFFYNALQLVQSAVLLARGTSTALLLMGDVLCLHLAVLITLLCFALSTPELDAGLPLSMVCGLLGAEWMIGLRSESLYMLPVLPALLLVYAFTHSQAGADHPRSGRPSALVLPAAAVLLALSALIAPPEGTKSPTLSRAAEQLREMINDRFFFQQERARYTLATDGWMPLGERRLGGRPEPDPRPVMEVTAPELVYLRGAILDAYTGASWYDSISARRYYWASPSQRALRDEVLQAAYPLSAQPAEREVAVRMLAGSATTLFLPQRLRALTVGERMTPYFNLSSEIFITRNLESGNSYEARYLSMKATDSGMSALAEQHAALADPGHEQAAARYTALPGHIQQEIRDIAQAVTANCATPWQKATALRDYLRRTYPYTLEVETPPADVDFVAWFLLAEKQGYCTYFASAMTVLCRIAGLPARYVEGYIARPGADGTALVRGTDAHAWTEVYISGLGWVTFDATPGQGDRDESSSAPPPALANTPTPPPPGAATPTPPPEDGPTPDPDGSAAPPTPDPGQEDAPSPAPSPEASEAPSPAPPQKNAKKPLPWLWLLLILAVILLLAWRIRTTAPLQRADRAKNDDDALLILWQAILRSAEGLKAPCRADETPLVYGARASQALGVPLTAVARAFSALRYGRHHAPRGAVTQAREIYRSLQDQLSLPRKLAFALRRALGLQK